MRRTRPQHRRQARTRRRGIAFSVALYERAGILANHGRRDPVVAGECQAHGIGLLLPQAGWSLRCP